MGLRASTPASPAATGELLSKDKQNTVSASKDNHDATRAKISEATVKRKGERACLFFFCLEVVERRCEVALQDRRVESGDGVGLAREPEHRPSGHDRPEYRSVPGEFG